jgi:hypothetical protein
LAIAGFLLMAAAALFISRRPDEGQEAAAHSRPASKVAPGTVDELDVVREGVRTVLRADGTGLRVTTPVADRADPAGALTAFQTMEQLQFLALVTSRRSRHAELQVDDAKGVRVTARHNGQPVLDLVFGKILEAEHVTMVRLADSDDVWQVRGELRGLFDKSVDDWRDRTITAFDAWHADRIEITAADGAHLVLRKTGNGAGPRVEWAVVESSVAIDKPDIVLANQLVDTMSTLKAAYFADGANAADAGLDPPELTVAVHVAGAATPATVLVVGKPNGKGQSFVKSPLLPQIFLVAQYNIDRAGRRPIQFRDKTLCNINDADVIAFSVTNGPDSYAIVKRDGTWHATAPANFVADPEKVTPLATVFRGWTAPEIAETPPADAMNRLQVVIVGRSKKATCTIQVGGEPKDHEPAYYVRAPTSRDLYVVPKWMIDRIAVHLDRITKT